MRIKTSITLAEHLLEQIDASTSNRSAFIEQVMQDYFKKLKKAERDARDLELINKNAKWLNEEAQDVLEYQELFLGEMEKEPVAWGVEICIWQQSQEVVIQKDNVCTPLLVGKCWLSRAIPQSFACQCTRALEG